MKRYQLKLQFNNGFEWYHQKRISFKGYFFVQKDQYLTGTRALEYFADITSAGQLPEKLKALDGCFSVVIQLDDSLLLGVDTLSFFPLFYMNSDYGWIISDSWYALRDDPEEDQLNREAFAEFRASGFVLGNQTLDRRIRKTGAGQVISLQHDGNANMLDSFDFLPSAFKNPAFSEAQQGLLQVLESLSRRLISSLEGRTAVVPLSGGYDSRLIACLLKKAGYQKVVCITYGRANPESRISQKVANALGYQWHMVDYSDTRLNIEDPDFQKYYRYMGNGFSMPYLQEYFAAKQLKEKGVIPPDAIFLPGHTGDWLAGSYLEKTIRNRLPAEDLPGWLTSMYFNFLPLNDSTRRGIISRIRAALNEYPQGPGLLHPVYNVLVENWEVHEKLPKFIFHSSHVFPFFGYQLRFPLWDKSLREFFRNLDFTYRKNQLLYKRVLETYYFQPLGVDFNPGPGPDPFAYPWVRSLKNKLRKMLPKKYILAKLRKNDYICYESFTREMNRQLQLQGKESPKKIFSFNASICNWYLNTLDAENQLRKPGIEIRADKTI